MITTTCANVECGVDFSIPDHIWNQIRRIGNDRWIYCPNGHRSHWAKSEADELEAKVADLEARLESMRSLKNTMEGEISGLHRTISYWKGIAHRGRK